MSCLNLRHATESCRRAAQSLVGSFLLLAFLSVAELTHGFTDKMPDIATQVPSTTTVRAVFDAAQLTSDTTSGIVRTPLVSSSYLLCSSSSSSGDSAAVASKWCSPRSGVSVDQVVSWSTIVPPVIQWTEAEEVIAANAGAVWSCLLYSCDGSNVIQQWLDAATSSVNVQLPSAIGGFGVATPCCASTNSSFIIYNTRGLIVQTNALPIAALNDEARDLASAYLCQKARNQSSTAVCGTPAMSYCIIRQLSPYFQWIGSLSGSMRGDGGLVFYADVSLCGVSVSDRLSYASASLLQRGFAVVLATFDGVNALSLPYELVQSILSWVSSTVGETSTTSSLSRSSFQRCHWYSDDASISEYRTGEYVECTIVASARELLPPLMLSIDRGYLIDSTITNSTCQLAIDLNLLVNASTSTFRLYSTGSLEAIRADRTAATEGFGEPVIVVGMQLLQGSTIAVSRNAVVPSWAAVSSSIANGLPVLYIAAPQPESSSHFLAASSADNVSLCVTAEQCAADQTFFPSVNRCGSLSCLHVIAFIFDPVTLRCRLRPAVVTVSSVMFVVLVAAEVVLLLVRRKTEAAKEEHLRLLEQVQRKATADGQ